MEGDIKMALENLRLLKAEMEKNDWIICSFLFSYKRIEYAVLVNRFTEKEKKKEWINSFVCLLFLLFV